MTNRTLHAFAFAVLSTVSTAAQAQTGPAVGEPIRVATAEGVLSGRLVATVGDTLVVDVGPPGPVPRGPYRRVTYGEVESVDVRVPHSRWRGAAVGAGVGAGIVAVGTAGVVGYITATEPEAITVYIIAIGVAALVPTAAVGAAIGALAPGTRWETLSPGRLSLSPVALGRGGGGVRLRVHL